MKHCLIASQWPAPVKRQAAEEKQVVKQLDYRYPSKTIPDDLEESKIHIMWAQTYMKL
jgi:hypothetical protein